jgi:hypothetical protein
MDDADGMDLATLLFGEGWLVLVVVDSRAALQRTGHHGRLHELPPNAIELLCAMELNPTLLCSLHFFFLGKFYI